MTTSIKSSYLDLLNKFWRKNQVYSFNAQSMALYFYLLDVNNAGEWSVTFNHTDKRILAILKCSRATLLKSKQSLVEAGLLFYKAGGAHYGAQTEYSFEQSFTAPVAEVAEKVNANYVYPSGKVIESKNVGATDEAPKTTPKAIKYIINVDLAATNNTPKSIPKPIKCTTPVDLGATDRTSNLTPLNIILEKTKEKYQPPILNIDEILAFEFKDRKQRNLEGFIRNLQSLGAKDNDLKALLQVSEFGVIGHPIWKYIADVKSSNGTIKQPIAFIKSRVLPADMKINNQS